MSGGGYVLGVDGGGTKTLCVCVSVASREEVGRAEEGSTNWNSVGSSVAKDNLLHAMQNALKAAKVDLKEVKGVCLGMSGVDRPPDKVKVAAWVQELFPHLKHNYTLDHSQSDDTNSILIENDAVAALASGTNGKLYGAVVISGTGMIVLAYAKDGVTHKRSGGWGPLLGDEGSGYDIGQEILKAVVRAEDGVAEATDLTPTVLQHLNLTKPQDLIGWAYNEKDQSWKKIADLAPLIISSIAKGDKVATKIIDKAAQSLLINITAAVKSIGIVNENFSLVLAGGNLTHDNSVLARVLTEKVKATLPSVNVVFPSVNAAQAAGLLIINHMFK